MRRRLDGQEMLDRDQQVARLREQGVPFRAIAARLGCSLGSVQKAMHRAQARRADRAAAVVDDVDEEPAWPVRSVGVNEAGVQWWVDERGRRFNDLDLYRAQRYNALRAAGRDPRQAGGRHA